MYSGSVELTSANVMGLLYASKKYLVSGLSAKCCGFVENQLNVANACQIMEQVFVFLIQDIVIKRISLQRLK